MLVKDLQRIPVPKTFCGITPQLCGDFLTHSRKRLPHIPHFGPWTFPEVWGQCERPLNVYLLQICLRISVIAAVFPRPETNPPGLRWLRMMCRINTPDETSYCHRYSLICFMLCQTVRLTRAWVFITTRLHLKVQHRDFRSPSGEDTNCKGWIPWSVAASMVATRGKADLLVSKNDQVILNQSQKLFLRMEVWGHCRNMAEQHCFVQEGGPHQRWQTHV